MMSFRFHDYLNKNAIAFGIFRQYKSLKQLLRESETNQKQILLIFGCQRSGTSLMYWIFERDLNTKIFRESSSLSSNDRPKKLRLNPLPEIRAIIEQQRAPIIVFKPLVESQHASELLEYFDRSKALWMYRHYRDVVSSNIRAFGTTNGINDIRPIVINDPNNWRSENVSAQTRSIVCQYFSEDMNPYDAAALFWFARNRLFFELNLQQKPEVMICRYEELCKHPAIVMREVYNFLGCAYPGDHIVIDVHHRSVFKDTTVPLSPEIDSLCSSLLSYLDAAYYSEV